MVSEKSRTGWYFLLIVIIIYVICSLIKPELLMPALRFFWSIIIKILPIFALIFAIMFIVNYFVTPKMLVKYLGKSAGIKSWFIAIISGIISTGPIYMWYPMLSEMMEKDVRKGLVAVFLYSRAVKPALMPLMIFYFGLSFTIVLTIVLIIFSVIQGFVLEKIVGG